MKLYSILAILSVFLTIYWDKKSRIGLLIRPIFYLFLFIIFGFKVLVNGALTAEVVRYNPAAFIGFRIGTIPIEDFLFGFSMVTLTIHFWEKFKKAK